MRVSAMLVLSGSLLTADVAYPQGAAKNEQEKLQGTWQVLRQEYDGSDEALQETKLVISAGKIVIKTKQEEKTMAYKLDSGTQPKSIDLTLEIQGKKIELTGIYLLDGETLKICASEKGQARPTEFVSPKGSRFTLFVVKRVKS